MIKPEDFIIEQGFEQLSGYDIYDEVKEKLNQLAVQYVKQNMAELSYVLTTVEGEQGSEQKPDMPVMHIIGFRDDGVDYIDPVARVHEIKEENISGYNAFFRLDMVYKTQQGACGADWYYMLSRVKYDPSNCYPGREEVVCK